MPYKTIFIIYIGILLFETLIVTNALCNSYENYKAEKFVSQKKLILKIHIKSLKLTKPTQEKIQHK